ncbi:hypothetical protein I302_100859 [Kwoniella bestiolae CBS 10118]|uniref:protein-tyrosine-phosphatase n=1 Tax=Kwoniella bestiolae CBS 10118 TaxID=1296100 RepID=A0A1B9G692_9TREE|nr:hypothetical protein I302_04232 [Kwoniella bestiolae CBS 10118]OCF26546.1 hypothetical protein I302_04232 [Kwoniella bestiolae CBS 10118]
MDVEMDTNSMEGVIIQPKPSLPPSPSFSSSSTSSLHSTARPRLGRLDTSSSLDFEPGLSVRSYPSSSSINDMSNSPPKPSSLPPVMHLKRNPKKLSLSLPPLATSTTAYSSNSSPNCSTPSTVCPTPTYSTAESDSKFGTPYTPGPPKTPALAMSLGRSTFRGNRRPSLLSLITNPPGNDDVPPPTPGAVSHPYATMRLKNKGRARSQTAIDVLGLPDQHHQTSAFGNSTFPPINEADNHQHSSGLSALGYALPTTSSPRSQSSAYNGSSPTTSTSTVSDDASASASTSSTPSTSPPLPTAFTFAMPLNNYNHHPAKRQMEPYEDGPIEILPGIFLGAEESVFQFDSYAPSSSKVRIINVAQEIDDPFDPSNSNVTPGWSRSKGKQKMKFAMYPASTDGSNQRPEIEYCHVRWSHGELGLADIPDEAELAHLLDVPDGDLRNLQGTNGDGIWGFWETIKWMEGGRRNGIPILIHCQCGVSRSATLAIAYTMALAAIGAMPDILGGIRSMQDAYDFVKLKSSWIGPNHSLVFQLVDFARHLTQLLSTHPDTMQTSFPCNHDAELSEAEWARRRREFEESENGSVTSASSSEEKEKERGRMEGGCCISPEEADEEARRLDEEMLLRKARR